MTRKPAAFFLVSIMLACFSWMTVFAQSAQADYRAIWFRLAPDANREALLGVLKEMGEGQDVAVSLLFPRHQHTQELSRIYEAGFSDEASGIRALQYLRRVSAVEYAEPKPVYQVFYRPNDWQSAQWNLAKINAADAWDIARGSAGVTLAVVDDFFDLQHPDLRNVWLYNSAEVPGNNIDDDGNGYIDDYAGWHAGYNIPRVIPPVARPSAFSHGTHCAGIAGAETDNGTGIASIGFGLKILPVAIGDSSNPGRMLNAFQGVVYAADRGAHIISLSWGSYAASATGQQAIDYAHNKGALIIAAAGNDNTDLPVYPGGYNHVVAVASTDSNDQKSPFSNYGTWVDLSAPGSAILSTLAGSPPGYGNMSGTSMAAPLTAGLAGLMLSHNPQLLPTDMETLLEKTAFDHYPLNPSFSGKLGGGRIDAAAAIRSIVRLKALFTENKRSVCPKDTVRFQFSGYGSSLTYRWSFQGGNPSVSSAHSPRVVYNNPGVYDVQLIVSDGSKADTLLKKSYVQVSIPTATLNTDTAVASGNTLFLRLGFTGVAPWQVRMQLVDSTRWFTAVQSPFYIEHKALKSGVFKILQFNDARCSAPESDSVKVRVYTAPPPGPDSCYVSVNKKRIQTLFSYAYGSSGKEAPTGLIVLSDSNYLFYGTTTGFGAGGEDALLAKIKRNGQIIWTRTIGQSGFDGGLPIHAKEMSNGDILVVGASAIGTGRWQGTVVRLSAGGALRWSRIYPALSAHDHLRGLTELPDGSIVVVGTSGQPSNQSASLIRFTANGTQSWKKMHDFNGIAEHYLDVHHIRNRLYLFGTASRGTGGVSSIVAKKNLNGDKIWEYRYETSGGNLLMYAAPAADNSGFACAGYGFVSGTSSNVQAHIAFVDTNGTLLWMKDFGGTGIERLTAITRGSDNEFYAIGFTQSKDAVSKLMVIRFDKNGNVKWDRIYGSKGVFHNTPDFGAGIARDVNDGIVTASAYNQTDPDALILSLSHCGESNCYSEKAGFTYRSLSVSRSNAQTTELTGNTPSSWSVTVGSHNTALKKLDLCPKMNDVKCDLQATFSYTPKCTGDTLLFINNSKDANGLPLSFFSWTINDTSTIPGLRDLKYAFTKPGKYKVTLYVWSHEEYLCKDTFIRYVSVSDSLRVRAGGKSGLCIGDTVRLQAMATCGSHPLRYQWFRNGVKLGDAAFLLVAPNTAGWYRVRVTDASSHRAEDSVFVSVDPACCKHNAALGITGNPWRCEGDSLIFINRSDNAAGTAYHWLYQTPAGVLTHTGQTSITLYAKQAGRYTARLIAQSSTCRPDTAWMEIKVLSLPLAAAGPDTFLCTPDTVLLGSEEQRYQHTYHWSPVVGLDNPNAHQARAHVTASTKYFLQVTNEATGCTAFDTVSLLVANKYYFRLDTAICAGDSIAVFHSMPASMRWNTGVAANPLWIKQAGSYWLTPQGTSKCQPSDTVQTRIKPVPPAPVLKGDTFICIGKTAQIQPGIDTSIFTARWHDGVTQFRRIFHTPGWKRLTIRANGCYSTDSVYLPPVALPKAPEWNDTSICTGDSIVIQIPDNGLTYAWNDGFTGRYRTLKTQGLYQLRVSNGCGTDTAQMSLRYKNIRPPVVGLPEDTGFCASETFALDLSQPGTTFSWNDGYTGAKRILDKPGLYIVKAENECYSLADSMRLRYLLCDCHVFVPNAFTPQDDGINDKFKATTDCYWDDFEMRIYNRWGEKIFSTRDVQMGWDGKYKGAFCPDGVYVYVISGVIPQSGYRRRYSYSGSFHLMR